MPTVVITGANRGLGLEFAKQYQGEGWKVIAACRNPDGAALLRSLGVSVFQLDLNSLDSIEAFGASLEGEPVDLLINNAAVHDRVTEPGFSSIDPELWMDAFKANVMGPTLVTQALLTNLRAAPSAVAATIGSQQGCLNTYEEGGVYAYRTTKAAAHAAVAIMALDLREYGIPYVCLRPGHTKTDMGGETAPYEIDDSVSCMRQVLATVDLGQSGHFIDRSGTLIPWSLEEDLYP